MFKYGEREREGGEWMRNDIKDYRTCLQVDVVLVSRYHTSSLFKKWGKSSSSTILTCDCKRGKNVHNLTCLSVVIEREEEGGEWERNHDLRTLGLASYCFVCFYSRVSWTLCHNIGYKIIYIIIN